MYVERLYLEPAGFILGIFVMDLAGIIWVSHVEDGFRLLFLLRKQHKGLEQMSRDLFGEAGFEQEGKKGSKTISVQLPEMWLEAAQIVETVIRGYGATENTRLIFDLRKVKGKGLV